MAAPSASPIKPLTCPTRIRSAKQLYRRTRWMRASVTARAAPSASPPNPAPMNGTASLHGSDAFPLSTPSPTAPPTLSPPPATISTAALSAAPSSRTNSSASSALRLNGCALPPQPSGPYPPRPRSPAISRRASIPTAPSAPSTIPSRRLLTPPPVLLRVRPSPATRFPPPASILSVLAGWPTLHRSSRTALPTTAPARTTTVS
ncbi:MAG: hypothetical protein JWN34_3944 [Bryobacterales bacterium]|nr:hypothetical protein [Bryobacterales bacterium]